jgi:hypothetical protein
MPDPKQLVTGDTRMTVAEERMVLESGPCRAVTIEELKNCCKLTRITPCPRQQSALGRRRGLSAENDFVRPKAKCFGKTEKENP